MIVKGLGGGASMISTLCTLNLDAASVALVHSECQQCKSGLSSIPQCTFGFGPSFFFFFMDAVNTYLKF